MARYTDALGVAAEQIVGEDAVRRLDDEADQIALWLTECPAWETLRADPLGLAADGHDPVALLRQAEDLDELDTARDPAAVLDYRLQLLVPEKVPGPLPWLRGIPSRIARDEVWGPYLQARADRIEGLADSVRREVRSHRFPSNWLGVTSTSLRMFESGGLIGDIAVWRAGDGGPGVRRSCHWDTGCRGRSGAVAARPGRPARSSPRHGGMGSVASGARPGTRARPGGS